MRTFWPGRSRQISSLPVTRSNENERPRRKTSKMRGLFFASMFLLVCLTFILHLQADTLSGTVQDPSGAVVAGARIEISGGSLPQAVALSSDENGKFSAPDLRSGKYSVKVTKEGFEDLITAVDLHGTADLALKLTIAE